MILLFLKTTLLILSLKFFISLWKERKNYKLAKWISRKIFLDRGVVISVNKILGWVSEEFKLTKQEQELVSFYKDYVNNMLNDVVTIIENPQNPMGIKKVIDKYAEENGTWEKLDEFNKTYIPNNPNEVVLVIYDHIGLQKKKQENIKNLEML